ncbi:MAG: hypothetical protein R3Y59_02810, partial [bacterium]
NTSDEAIDLGNESTAKPKQKMFRTNTGKQQRIYPKKHPYFPKDCGSCDRNVNLAYDANNPRCKGCMVIKSCIDNELVETTSKKWIKDAIEKTKDGYCCKRAITIGDVPSEVIQFAKKRGVELKDTTIKVTDDAIRHAIRSSKKDKTISNRQMENISQNIKSAEVYYDSSKNNYMFICKDSEESIKYVVNCNYTNKADGKKITGNFFVTAGKIDSRNLKGKVYTKIK